MCTICGGCARAASGATQRDSHELLNLTLVTVSEGAGVMPQGSYLAAPSEGRPRRFPSRGDGRADFVGSKNKCRRRGGLRTHMCRGGSAVHRCFYSSLVLPRPFWHGFTVSGTRALLVSTVLLAAHSTFPKQCLRLALQQILTGPGPPNGWPRCVQEASAVFLSPWWCDAAVERVRLTAPRVGVAGLARCPSRQRQIWTRLRTRFELGVVQDLVALGVPQWAARAHTGLTAPQSNGGRWDGAAASSVPARATGAAASSGRSSQIQ
jgi:hypothetical protein